MKNPQFIAIARQLSEGPHASVLNSVIEEFNMKWAQEIMIKDSEFTTIVAVAEREGRIRALKLLQQELNIIAQGND